MGDTEQSSNERLAPEGFTTWNAYWVALGMPWRTEPEIDKERQGYLVERRAVNPNIEKGIYPFRDENGPIKLTRADVEWLLAEHGPVNWSEESQRNQIGIDIRGAKLQGEDLSDLPLARLQGGVSRLDWQAFFEETSQEQRDQAAVHFEGATLRGVHLEQSVLSGAYLEGANLRHAHLEEAILPSVHMEGADLTGAHLELAAMWQAHLEGATINGASLHGAGLVEAHLQGAGVMGPHLDDFSRVEAHFERADIFGPHFEGASLRQAHLGGVQLNTDDAARIHQWTAGFPPFGRLPPANLRGAFFDGETMLHNINLGDDAMGCAFIVDVNWGNVNLSTVDWAKVTMLGSEWAAHMSKRLLDYEAAVRASRQLAVVLRSQGLNDHADRFAYRAQVLHRIVQRRRHQYLHYIGSLLLSLLAGYGYRPGRAILLYLAVIIWFANFYAWAARGVLTFGLAPSQLHGLPWYEALVLSASAFHGRGFFQPLQSLGDPVAILAAIEAVCGLIIEVSFIATFTQRFFGK